MAYSKVIKDGKEYKLENESNIKIELNKIVSNIDLKVDKIVVSKTGAQLIFLKTNKTIRNKPYYIVLGKGTTPTSLNDWRANLNHLNNQRDEDVLRARLPQYYQLGVESRVDHQRDTVEEIMKLKKEKGNIFITCIGHSKGGGDCNFANEKIENLQSIGFDPSGVDIRHKNKYKETIRDSFSIVPKNDGKVLNVTLNKVKNRQLNFKFSFSEIKLSGIEIDTNGLTGTSSLYRNTHPTKQHQTGVINPKYNINFIFEESDKSEKK